VPSEPRKKKPPETKSSGKRLVIETRGNSVVLICADCERPFLSIENGALKFQNKHGAQLHENTINLEQLRTVIFEGWKQLHPTEYW
jgi:ribosome-binding ATPase YchF (GTP1/OBG family)